MSEKEELRKESQSAANPDGLSFRDYIALKMQAVASAAGKAHISSADLAKELPNGQFFADNSELEKTLRAVASPGDIILTVGAGDVYRIGEKLLEN